MKKRMVLKSSTAGVSIRGCAGDEKVVSHQILLVRMVALGRVATINNSPATSTSAFSENEEEGITRVTRTRLGNEKRVTLRVELRNQNTT